MELYELLSAYVPYDEQERADKAVMLDALNRYDDLYDRSNLVLHLTASAWIVNSARDRVLMVFHNIYRSWSWTGGHADGERDMLTVALQEAQEETALTSVRPVHSTLFSIETLLVRPHHRRGEYVPAHLHLNTTFLLEADDKEPIRPKPDENSAVAWFSLSDAVASCAEEQMQPIYRKLNAKLEALCKPEN